jgi:hypothetical protein
MVAMVLSMVAMAAKVLERVNLKHLRHRGCKRGGILL